MDLMQETKITNYSREQSDKLIYVLAEVNGKVITGTIISENYKEAAIQTDTGVITVNRRCIRLRK